MQIHVVWAITRGINPIWIRIFGKKSREVGVLRACRKLCIYTLRCSNFDSYLIKRLYSAKGQSSPCVIHIGNRFRPHGTAELAYDKRFHGDLREAKSGSRIPIRPKNSIRLKDLRTNACWQSFIHKVPRIVTSVENHRQLQQPQSQLTVIMSCFSNWWLPL